MKRIAFTLFTLHFSTLPLFHSSTLYASPFANDPATEVVVYSPASSSPLHVSTFSPREFDKVVSRSFPSSYSWHRSVCQMRNTTTNDDFCAWIGGDAYTPGDPFGVSSCREAKQVELTGMSAITTRVNLWTAENDRAAHGIVETNSITWYSEVVRETIVDEHGMHYEYITNVYPKKISYVTAPMDRVMVKVSRFLLDGYEVGRYGLQNSHLVVYSNVFNKAVNQCLHEGHFISDGGFDIDWDHFSDEVVDGPGVRASYAEITNVVYMVTFGNDPTSYDNRDSNTVIRMLPVTINRRFAVRRSIPTPVFAKTNSNDIEFAFRIDDEDTWASQFGTTYTAFRVKVLNGSTELWNSGFVRLPPRDDSGVYHYKVDAPSSISSASSLTWRVAVYNSKFSNDERLKTYKPGDPYSAAQQITVIGD